MSQVIIRRGKDGMELGVELADFRRKKLFKRIDGTMETYEAAGFEIVSYADGRPYTPPAPKSEGKA